jgi:hypothetical protein
MPTAREPSPQSGRRRVLPQPAQPAWSAALRPSQRRAAEHRDAAEDQRTVAHWLREPARR